jgi:arabinofuranosyltransferase
VTGLLPLAMILGFSVVLFRTAWIMEDAYIMFRTIDNALHGYGLTFNVTERVETYTCPFWMLLLLPFHGLTGEYFFTALAVSAAVSLVGLGVLAWRVAPTTTVACLAIGLCTLSKGFVEYSTSGLENPLNHLLAIVFCVVYFRIWDSEPPTSRQFFWLMLVASLGMFNRLDTALLYGPALLLVFWQLPKAAALKAGLLGAAPLVLWEIFSLIYYGFLFPNTAYAKLNLGLPASFMWMQGLGYYLNALNNDPLMLLVIALGMLTPIFTRQWRLLPLTLGIALYLVYIVKIGGDYMSMRFFTTPFVIALALVCRLALLQRPIPALTCLGAALALSWLMPGCPLRTGADYGRGLSKPEADDAWMVCDLRLRYYKEMGLLPLLEQSQAGEVAMPLAVEEDRRQKRHDERVVKKIWGAGRNTFREAERFHALDLYALADAFLARLPMWEKWLRPGHYRRHIPIGYERTLVTGENCLVDPKLAHYYEQVKLIIAGDLWDRRRWRAIWKMNTGQFDHLIDMEHYRRTSLPPPQT